MDDGKYTDKNGKPYYVIGGNVYIPWAGYEHNDEWELVPAQDVVDFNGSNQNAIYRNRAQSALDAAKGNGGSNPFQNLAWHHFGEGLGEWGRSFLDMGKAVWDAIPKVNTITMGEKGGGDNKDAPPPKKGAKNVTIDMTLMEWLMIVLGQNKYEKGAARDAVIGPEKEGEAISESLQVPPPPADTIHYLKVDSTWIQTPSIPSWHRKN